MTMTPPATLTRLLLLVAAAGLLAGVGVAVTGAHAQQQQQQDSPFCRQVAALVEQEPCVEPVPRDVVFLVDKSYSMNATQLNEDVLSYTQQLFCSLDAAAGSRVGLISFGFDVRVDVPLAARSADEWGQAVEALKGNLDTTDGYTPLAEALETAALEFARAGDASHARLVIIVSDGQPFPMPVGRAVNPHDAAVVDTGFPLTGYPQYAARYYPTDVCLPAASDARSCEDAGFPPVTYSRYLSQILPSAANALKTEFKAKILLLAVPNQLGETPKLNFFKGSSFLSSAPTCVNALTNARALGEPLDPECSGACDFCDSFPTILGERCICASLNGTVVTHAELDVFTAESYNVTEMVRLTRSSACQPAMSTAAIVGVAAGSTVAVCGLAFVVVVAARRRRSSGAGTSAAGVPAEANMVAALQDRREQRRGGGSNNAASSASAAWLRKYDANAKTAYDYNTATGEFAWANPQLAVASPASEHSSDDVTAMPTARKASSESSSSSNARAGAAAAAAASAASMSAAAAAANVEFEVGNPIAAREFLAVAARSPVRQAQAPAPVVVRQPEDDDDGGVAAAASAGGGGAFASLFRRPGRGGAASASGASNAANVNRTTGEFEFDNPGQ